MPEKINTSFTQNDYEIIKRDVPYQGRFRVAKYELRFKQYDGNWSEKISREILERQAAVGILPYDPVLDQIILIEQFRAGALANPQSPWLVEIIAGIIDSDETPKAVAFREAQEEAGCEILDIFPICEYFVSPGGSNEFMTLYCGHIDASNAGGIFGLQDEGEDIRAFTLSADEAFILLQEGKIKTPPAIISLQWLQLNRDWLKQLWQTR